MYMLYKYENQKQNKKHDFWKWYIKMSKCIIINDSNFVDVPFSPCCHEWEKCFINDLIDLKMNERDINDAKGIISLYQGVHLRRRR